MSCGITNLTVAGLGGQGVLKITDIVAEVMFRLGFDVKKSEVHGMSQRGGSVSSEVRFGCDVASPMVPEGESDYLVVLEDSQIEVNLGKLKKGGVLIVRDDVPVDKLANPKALNIMMLGALSVHFDVPEEKWVEVIKENLPAKVLEMNLEMFRLGRSSVRKGN